jgi:hypothetical protein
VTLPRWALCALSGWLALYGCGGDGGTSPDGDSNRLPQAIIQNGSDYLVFIAGDELELIAASTDVDGDALTHTWTLSGTNPGSLSATSGAAVTWTASAGPGSATISLVSNDGTADSPVPARLDLSIGVPVAPGSLASGTWIANDGPFVVEQNIVLPQGNTLELGPGVQVYFRGTMGPGGLNKPSFTVSGVLRALGTGTNRSAAVSLRGGRNLDIADGAQWDGLLVDAVGGTPIQLNYCRVENAETGIVASGTAELRLFGAILENNITGLSCVDPDGTTIGQGVVSTTSLRRVRIVNQRSTGIQAGSSNLTMRKCRISNNAAGGLSIQAATDPAVADLDSCILELNGGSGGANLSFSNQSAGTLFSLRVHVKRSNFRADPVNHPNNVSWGGCNLPSFAQDFDLRGNFWASTTNDQSALAADILPTMTGYGAGCDDDASSWLLSAGDWVTGAHATGAP